MNRREFLKLSLSGATLVLGVGVLDKPQRLSTEQVAALYDVPADMLRPSVPNTYEQVKRLQGEAEQQIIQPFVGRIENIDDGYTLTWINHDTGDQHVLEYDRFGQIVSDTTMRFI